jgi:hypothetical protein
MINLYAAVLCASVAASHLQANGASECFCVDVVDAATSRGIPLVEVITPDNVVYMTDSAGRAAICDFFLMGRPAYYRAQSHGYEMPADGFGMRGKTLTATPGGKGTIVLKRLNVAERLYRITGAGIYWDTIRLGKSAPIREPLLNSGVFGQDSAQYTIHRGQLFCVWGDTGNAGHPLSANFKATAARIALPGKGGLDPDIGMNLSYIGDKNFVKKIADIPEPGPVWLGSLMSVPDGAGISHLMANYARIAMPGMVAVERGLVEFDEKANIFRRIRMDNVNDPATPNGHVLRAMADHGGCVVFPSGTSYMRAPDNYEGVKDLSRYESMSCLPAGSKTTTESVSLERDSAGRVVYRWKNATLPTGYPEQQQLVKSGVLKPNETTVRFTDIETSKPVTPQANSIAWNPYRHRWVMIFSEIGGTSMLGEVWYAEADAAVGPWIYCHKIVTHNTYSFYNPVQHPWFAKRGGRDVYFEGTYTTGFSGATAATPRYDYNQIMYKADLDDARLHLPIAIYEMPDGTLSVGSRARIAGGKILCYAPDRPRADCIPIYYDLTSNTLSIEPAGHEGQTLFYAMAPEARNRHALAVRLVRVEGDSGKHRYSVEILQDQLGSNRSVLCYVWPDLCAGAAMEDGMLAPVLNK